MPDCEEISLNKDKWVLNENEFSAEEKLESYLKSNGNNDSFLFYIISFLYDFKALYADRSVVSKSSKNSRHTFTESSLKGVQ
jgi:hypothetical protein